MIKVGLSDVRRPFGVFLFVGPTGVGKTHLARTLAQLLFGSRERMVRIKMPDFPKEEDALLLMGNPEASAGSQVRPVDPPSCLDKPIRAIARAANIQRTLTPRFMRRTFQDLGRAGKVHDFVCGPSPGTPPRTCRSGTAA